MKRKFILTIIFSVICGTAFSQFKIPLNVSGNTSGMSNSFDNSILSVTGQNAIGVTFDSNNKVYLGLLAPVRYVLTDVNLAKLGTNQLFQNYPNPFKQQTTISFEISKSEKVKLTVIDVLGQHVDLLLNQELTPGKHQVLFDAGNIKPGIYLYRLESNNFWETKNMILTH
jgi:hypothetical protein